MGTNKVFVWFVVRFRRFNSAVTLGLVLFLFSAAALAAQEPAFRIEESGREIRFIQRLSWEREEYASGYEVTVEMESRDTPEGPPSYSPVLREFTQNDFIDVSLSPGWYRYRITAYDFMDKPAGNPPWIALRIFPALRPELKSFSPDRLYLDTLGKDTLTLVLHGRDLAPGAAAYLKSRETEALIPGEFAAVPGAENSGATEGRLTINVRQLESGNYDVYIRNPGGLSASAGVLRVMPSRPRELALSAGYSPLVPLYGELNTRMNGKFFPAGAFLCIGLVPFKGSFGNIGFEAVPSWNYLSSVMETGEAVTGHMAALHIYALFEKPLNPAMSLKFRAGGGIFAVFDFKYTGADPTEALIPSASAGISFRWLVKAPFFVEAGADYFHLFSADATKPGYLRPLLGAGWRF